MLKLSILFFFLIPTVLLSQELNCRVIINAQAIQSSDPSTISEMEVAFSEFLNNTKWTSDQFKVEERINCNTLYQLELQRRRLEVQKLKQEIEYLRQLQDGGFEN